jgi:hypothetical protein
VIELDRPLRPAEQRPQGSIDPTAEQQLLQLARVDRRVGVGAGGEKVAAAPPVRPVDLVSVCGGPRVLARGFVRWHLTGIGLVVR